ncbi:hypothetical protein [Cellulomonas bogoriensis]|uniref:Uncharacterized protein n=1 Tax=Cellulomonas bogoriensis 69B4 = DSM 16987 TaxID=1386082 RepID=A0A0A0BZY4_9CELL|nr:hypothetical protein [Cellulomonas bogoriensis]KGM13510.1 hypothetical protein N869_13515 [Cellulomonas bogoriensis 69B4 = DSM 16987]
MQVSGQQGRPDEARVRLRASLTPWHRGVLYIGALVLGGALWLLGTRGPEVLEWARAAALIPLVGITFVVLRWQREALARG